MGKRKYELTQDDEKLLDESDRSGMDWRMLVREQLKLIKNDKPADIVDWLNACPEKGWFEPIPSDSTDSL